MKQLKSADAGFDCDAVVTADSTEEIMAQVGPHAKAAHGVDVTPEMEQQLAGLIKER